MNPELKRLDLEKSGRILDLKLPDEAEAATSVEKKLRSADCTDFYPASL